MISYDVILMISYDIFIWFRILWGPRGPLGVYEYIPSRDSLTGYPGDTLRVSYFKGSPEG